MTDETPKQEEVVAGGVLSVVGAVSNWKTYVIYALLGLVALEGVCIIWQRGNVAAAELVASESEGKLKDMTIARDLAQANEASCRVNFADQNNKIAEANKLYNKLQQEMLDLATDIANGKYYKPADDVRKQPAPKTCTDTLDFLKRNFP